jgi:hypothetical protein
LIDSSYKKPEEEQTNDNSITGDSESIFEELEKSLPTEPNQNEENVYIISFKYNDSTFTRRFSPENLILHLKAFVKSKIKTLKDVELFENFPKKIYNTEDIKISESGLSKQQVLFVRII